MTEAKFSLLKDCKEGVPRPEDSQAQAAQGEGQGSSALREGGSLQSSSLSRPQEQKEQQRGSQEGYSQLCH